MKFWCVVLTIVNVLPDNFNVGSRYLIDEIGSSVVAKSFDTTKPLNTWVIQSSYNNAFKYILNSYCFQWDLAICLKISTYLHALLNQRCNVWIGQISLFMGTKDAHYLNIWSLSKTSVLYLFMHMPALQPPTCTAIKNRRDEVWSLAKATKSLNVVVVILTKTSLFFAHVAYFTGRKWNKAASIQICQHSVVHIRRVLWLSCAKVFMINKMLSNGELATIVSDFKIFWETTSS